MVIHNLKVCLIILTLTFFIDQLLKKNTREVILNTSNSTINMNDEMLQRL